MVAITLTSQGQITIPASIRRNLGLKAGDKIDIRVNAKESKIELEKAPDVSDLRALVKKYVDSEIPPLENPSAYFQEHRER